MWFVLTNKRILCRWLAGKTKPVRWRTYDHAANLYLPFALSFVGTNFEGTTMRTQSSATPIIVTENRLKSGAQVGLDTKIRIVFRT